MATPFLKSVAAHVHGHYKDKAENICIVLPGKRGALFLKHYLGRAFAKTIWLPTIISAEDLVTELSGLKTLDELDLICHLYESYKFCYGPDAEPFDSFARWGQLMLQDFNEIDRYLADSEQLYENLKDIKVIENWSLGEPNLSEFQLNYLRFMSSIGAIYKHFSSFLLSHGWAYQGLAYRQAVRNLASSTYPDKFDKLLFCGFNALNEAEQKIFNHFLKQKKADILWDADEYYLKSPNHEAGLFLRRNFETFAQKDALYIEKNFSEEKQIDIISVPKQIGQAQVVKQTIQSLINKGVPLDKVAVVLANEKLLWPVLQQLPEDVEHVNITMEYPLRYTSTYALLDAILQIQLNYHKQTRKSKHVYHSDLVLLLKQPLFNTFLKACSSATDIHLVTGAIVTRNLSFIDRKHLHEFFKDGPEIILTLLTEAPVPQLCDAFFNLLNTLKEYFIKNHLGNRSALELEYLEVFIRNLNRLQEVIVKYPHFNDIRSFRQLFSQVVGSASAPFIGEPLRGLQVMGVLETRTLDFEYLVLVNVNEGVLPAGKSINSFIPNDLKRAFGLPLYLEKDAIYSYHFYRLLQRAREITITYDSETDTFGKGEKSRFVTQLLLELPVYNPAINVTHSVAVAGNISAGTKTAIQIEKNEVSLERIAKKVLSDDIYSGLSPSSLNVLVECGLKFYFRYGAGLKEIREVEESAEANTFGSILHLSLENLYNLFKSQVVTAAQLESLLPQTTGIVRKSFRSFFETDELAGKNLLQFEVIKVYVEKLVKSDISRVNRLKNENHVVTINELEKEFSAGFPLHINGKESTGYLRGKIDRIDSSAGKFRIIDYKNSVKDTDKFMFTGFETLFSDKNYSKQLQLVLYAWLLFKNSYCKPEQMQPCIIPFKNFQNEPVYIQGSDKKPLVITTAFLNDFEMHLVKFIEDLFNTASSFTQTEDVKTCSFCDFNIVCNRET